MAFSTNEEKLNKILDEAGLANIDSVLLAKDLAELKIISNSLPKDNILSIENCLKLERQCIRGMNICDYWYPIIHIVSAEVDVNKDLAKNKGYITAENTIAQLGGQAGKLTAEMRKACSETNEEYNNKKIISEKLKAMKMFFEKKRDTFKSAIFIFKDQLSAYKVSDKGSSGEDLGYSKENEDEYCDDNNDDNEEKLAEETEQYHIPKAKAVAKENRNQQTSNIKFGKSSWEKKVNDNSV